jgi:hypothetical protein
VSVQNGSAWGELCIGDSVSPSAAIRLDDEASAQLGGQGVEIVLTRPGIYQIHDIVVARKAFSSGGVGAAMASVFRKLVKGTSVDKGNVGGVRCAALLVDGKDLIGSGRNEEAIEQLSQALDSATGSGTAQLDMEAGRNEEVGSATSDASAKIDSESARNDEIIKQLSTSGGPATSSGVAQINYYLAYAYLEAGMLQKALKKTEGLRPGANDVWGKDFVLLRGRLLIECNSYLEAVAWLTTDEARALAQDESRAALYELLLGVAYYGAGDRENAKLALQQVVDISQESDLGKSAQAMLTGL